MLIRLGRILKFRKTYLEAAVNQCFIEVENQALSAT